MEHIELTKLQMTKEPGLNERWVQNLLADNPALLGLGDLDVIETERRQPHAGRLDLLLIDRDNRTRYEVELQLGPTDETHIIRTLEYWDIERRRYPQYEHIAVIAAEEITSRFFNVIRLFNGFIPIVAIQMTALRVDDDQVSLVFTKVMDHTMLGTDEEEDQGEPVDRNYWSAKTSPEILALVDRIHDLVKEDDPSVDLNYTKHYIGLIQNGTAKNYISIELRKQHVNLLVRHPRSPELSDMIEEAGIDTLPYDKWFGNYRAIIRESDVDEHRDLLKQLIAIARDRYTRRWGSSYRGE